ncbi:MAG: hypothetical protein ABIG44_05660 [Planctomycetota bacterium]
MRTHCAIVVLTVLVFAAGVAPAAGTTYYFTDYTEDGLWRTAGNWETTCGGGTEGQVPTASDNAVICTGKTCTIDDDNAVCLGLTVDGTLILGNGDTLQIGANSSIPGTMSVENYGKLKIAASLTLSGGSSITFGISYIEFQGDYTLTLASGTSLIGGFYMDRAGSGSYTFINNGTVETGDGSFNTVFVDGTIDGGWGVSDGVFKVTSSNASMIFESTCTMSDMMTEFEVTAGTLSVRTDVCTGGDLTFSGGEIEVKQNKTFRAGVDSCD